MRLHKNMLADQFCCHESHRLIGNLIFRKVARAVWQSLQDTRQQFVEASLLEGRDGDDLLKIMERLELRDQREQFALVRDEINFVEQQEDGGARLFREIEDVG